MSEQVCPKRGEPVFGCGWHTLNDKWASLECKKLPVPAPEPLAPSPEIRYQLRNWHHVTCGNFGGNACTCLDAREALIIELDDLFGGKRQ